MILNNNSNTGVIIFYYNFESMINIYKKNSFWKKTFDKILVHTSEKVFFVMFKIPM